MASIKSEAGEPALPEEHEAALLLQHALPFLLSRGFALLPPEREPWRVLHAPFSLLPRRIPRSAFERAYELAAPLSSLVDAIARERSWLLTTLDATAAADPFTGRLVSLFRSVCGEGERQPLYLALHRSDYMIDRGVRGDGEPRLRQIELNTIASSFACLSSRVGEWHAYAAAHFAGAGVRSADACTPASAAYFRSGIAGAAAPEASVRPSPSRTCLARALAAAHREYVRRHAAAADAAAPAPSPVVVFVVQPGERNVQDQRQLEYALWEAGAAGEECVGGAHAAAGAAAAPAGMAAAGIRVRRLTLRELGEQARLRARDGALLIPAEGLTAELLVGSAAAAGGSAEAAGGEGVSASTGAGVSAPLPSAAPTVALDAAAAAAAGWEAVSLVYYRAGYAPDDYPGEEEWAGRAVVERSLAVKCPPLAYHLAGTKKVQQALAAPGAVERFAASPAEAALIRSCFAGLWSLDPVDIEGDGDTAAAVAAAKAEPHRFVVKPQREGGGNNFYGADVAMALGAPLPPAGAADTGAAAGATAARGLSAPLSPSELAAYILMERVFPTPQDALLVRAGAVLRAAAVCELGVYGAFLHDGRAGVAPLLNEAAGHLLRTKVEGTDEGGVAAGFAVLDAPMLVER